MDLGGPFVNVARRGDRGNTAIHHLARNYMSGYDPGTFALLLERGAKIDDRNSLGQTCLHLCVESAHFVDGRELPSLVYLIRSGADVSAVDHGGFSVSLCAYCPNPSYDRSKELGGYRGDLWDAALAQCGRDINKMRESTPHPRRPLYTKRYTRQYFERLWRGFEHLCPYYHDPPIWWPRVQSSEHDEMDASISGHGEGDTVQISDEEELIDAYADQSEFETCALCPVC